MCVAFFRLAQRSRYFLFMSLGFREPPPCIVQLRQRKLRFGQVLKFGLQSLLKPVDLILDARQRCPCKLPGLVEQIAGRYGILPQRHPERYREAAGI